MQTACGTNVKIVFSEKKFLLVVKYIVVKIVVYQDYTSINTSIFIEFILHAFTGMIYLVAVNEECEKGGN